MPAYTILPAFPADAEAISSLFSTAFNEHPVLQHMWPSVNQADYRARNLALWKSHIARGPELGQRVFKVVDENGELLAFSRWLYPIPSPTPQKEQERWAYETASHPDGPLPGTDVPLTNAFVKDLTDGRAKHIDPKSTYFLHILAVKDGHRRKGLGRLLCEDVLKLADQEGREAYVEASPMGEGLYQSLGWERVRESVFNLGEYGVEKGGWGQEVEENGDVRLWCLMRKAKA